MAIQSEMDAGKKRLILRGIRSPQTPQAGDPRDPQGIEPGISVSVVPDGDGGDPPVTGTVQSVSRDSIAILRSDDRIGQVCVHFPRVGYRVAKL